MRIAIVGSEQAKFTPETEQAARAHIRSLLSPGDVVISGECHLGGVDIYAREEAVALGLEFLPFAPARLQWSGGYRERNLAMARACELCVCITVRRLPEGWDHSNYASLYCYHCHTSEHVKSGGCWTVKEARELGKEGMVIVV